MFPTTKTELAQATTSMILAATATHILRRQIDNHTSFDNETTSVKIGTAVAGNLIAFGTKPLTDKTIGIIARRFNKKSNGDIIDTHLVVE